MSPQFKRFLRGGGLALLVLGILSSVFGGIVLAQALGSETAADILNFFNSGFGTTGVVGGVVVVAIATGTVVLGHLGDWAVTPLVTGHSPTFGYRVAITENDLERISLTRGGQAQVSYGADDFVSANMSAVPSTESVVVAVGSSNLRPEKLVIVNRTDVEQAKLKLIRSKLLEYMAAIVALEQAMDPITRQTSIVAIKRNLEGLEPLIDALQRNKRGHYDAEYVNDTIQQFQLKSSTSIGFEDPKVVVKRLINELNQIEIAEAKTVHQALDQATSSRVDALTRQRSDSPAHRAQ